MKAIERLTKIRENQIMEVINDLTDLAIENRHRIHILVSVTPHTDDVTVTVYATDFDWSEKQLSQPLLLIATKLSEENALLNLLQIEDQVIELIAEARTQEENEVAA